MTGGLKHTLSAVRARAAALLGMLLLALCLPVVTDARAAPQVTIRGSLEKGFARIVLTFPEKIPEYNIRVTPGVLVLETSEAMDISVDRLSEALSGYVGVARADPDGKGIRMSLDQVIAVNTMEAGEQLFVDLLPANWRGLPPSLPQSVIDALAKRSEDLEKRRLEAQRAEEMKNSPPVDVRVATAPTFTRISFGWHKPIDATVTRDAERVNILFDHAAPINVNGFRSRLPNYVGEISSKVSLKGLEVFIDITPTATIRHFREGDAFVVDISDNSATSDSVFDVGGDAPASEPAVAAGQGSKKPGQTAPDDGDTPSKGKVLISEAPLTPGDSEKAAAQDEAVSQSGASEEPADQVTADEDKAGNLYTQAQKVQTGVRRIGDVYRIEFSFQQATPAALFARGDTLWMVFDSPLPIDTRPLRYELVEYVKDITVMRAGNSQALVLSLAKPVLSSSAVENTNWIVTIGDVVVEPARPITLAHGQSLGGEPAVVAPLEHAGSVHELIDPVIGDRVLVATALGPARAILSEQRFVDFTALATRHGIAILPKVDNLQVKVSGDVFSVEREKGLALSAVGTLTVPSGEVKVESALRPGYVHPEAPIESPEKLKLAGERFMRRVAEAEEGHRAAARLDYAEFLLSQRLAAEALGLLRLAVVESPETAREPSYRAMLGIALQQMHRPEEALKAFDFFGLNNQPDINLWMGMALLDLGRWREAQLKLDAGLPMLSDYPPEERARFMLGAARAAIEVNDYGAASDLLTRLKVEPAAAGQRSFTYLQARLAEGLGDREQAMALYSELTAEESRDQFQVLGQLRRLQLLSDAKTIDDTDMIKALETLSVTWRGDDTELQTLSTLADFYVRKGEFRQAFETMKAAAIAAPGEPRTRQLQDAMQAVFVNLFLGNAANGMKPVDALALYYDYKELTPVGYQGDEIIRALADRLISVDLLAKAAEILDHQVKNRLRGAARAQVAAKLALVYLMDRKPNQALRVLSLSRQAVLPKEVQKQRQLLEARALSETGRADLAIDLLRAASGPEVERLRADVFWSGRKWQEAGEALERVVGEVWQDNGPLSTVHRRDILRSAIAYALAGDDLGLARLRENFTEKMADTEDEQSFRIVTQPVKAQGSEFRALAASIAHTDTLQAFIREYREKYDRQAVVPQS
ncbi:MAG: hypothetical protein AB7O39_13275 [Flavobacteriaceae bacterium]